MKEFVIDTDRAGLARVAEALWGLRDRVKVYTFTGSLGAGKTTLIGEFLAQAGVNEPVTSPTFNYVNQYQDGKGQTFYHFDLYRLSSLPEFMGAGFAEYLYQPHSWAFVEWPEIIEPLLKKDVCHVTLEYIDEHTRRVRYTYE